MRTRFRSRMVVVAKVLALAALFVGTPCAYAGQQISPAGSSKEPDSYRVSVDVNLVLLHATVLDPKGRFVPDLCEQDFEVYEDGVLQRIQLLRREDIPVTVGLVVDHSRSMRPRLAEVAAAARSFVQSSNPEDEMFVVNFNEKVSRGLPAGIQFSNSSAELEQAIGEAAADGMTALYDAIAKSLEQLQDSNREKKVLIVISDGDDTASVQSRDQVMKMAERSGTIIYTVGLFDPDDPDANPGVLRRLARATGGEAYFPGQLNEVVSVCERIARDIRNQYILGYVSTNPARDGSYRSIRVLVRAPDRGKLTVRTRSGYTAGDEPRPGKGDDAK